jgi:uncharacterized membrane protein
MAERRPTRLDQPREIRSGLLPRFKGVDPERFGVLSEKFARFMGTPQFIIWMTIFVTVWLGINTYGPQALRFDPRELNYTLLTLILSLQASYAAPLILLAQNRQADRDKVALEQDRMQAERNLADTEFLTREVASLRLALRDNATRDFVRSELRDLLEELDARDAAAAKAKAAKKKARKAKAKATNRAAARAAREHDARAQEPTPESSTPSAT